MNESQAGGGGEHVGVSWGRFEHTFRTNMSRFLSDSVMSDVTLSNGSDEIKCHRVMLSSCSPYFEKLFKQISVTSHTVFFLKDAEAWEMEALLSYVYTGRARVPKAAVSRFCAFGKSLQVVGLDTTKRTLRRDNSGGTLNPVESNEENIKSEEVTKSANLEKSSYGQLDVVVNSKQKEQNATEGVMKPNVRDSSFDGGLASGSSKVCGGKLPLHQNTNNDHSNRVQEPSGRCTKKLFKPKIDPEVCDNEEASETVLIERHFERVTKALEDRDSQDMIQEFDQEDPRKVRMLKREEDVKVKAKQREKLKVKKEDIRVVEEEQEYIEIDYDDLAEAETDTEGLEEQSQFSRARSRQGKPSRAFAVVGGRKVYKYEKWEREQVMSALEGGLSLRQCSDVFNIPRKTLAKWRSQKVDNSTDAADGLEATAGPSRSQQGLNVFFTEPPIAFPPLDGNDRAERLKKAASLALAGVTVRQAAVHYALPRTTLCAYMKRQGLSGLKKPTSAISSRNNLNSTNNNKVVGDFKKQEDSQDSSEGFPFLGLSELVDNNEVHGWSAERYYVEDEEIECFEEDEPQERKKNKE